MTSDTYVGKTCPYCQTPIKPGAAVSICSACGMPHHAECWQENGRCTTFGCNGRPAGSGTAAAAPSVQRTPDGHAICPTCGYVMTPFDASCPRCENLRSQGRTPGPVLPPAMQPYAGGYGAPQPGYGTVPPPTAFPNPYAQPMPFECPYELCRWSWGAFGATLFWTAAMNQWGWFAGFLILAFCFPIGSLIISIYLGMKGNEQAWKSRQWISIEHFRSTQEVWDKWGIGLFVLGIVLGGCFFLLWVIGVSSGYSGSGY